MGLEELKILPIQVNISIAIYIPAFLVLIPENQLLMVKESFWFGEEQLCPPGKHPKGRTYFQEINLFRLAENPAFGGNECDKETNFSGSPAGRTQNTAEEQEELRRDWNKVTERAVANILAGVDWWSADLWK